MREIKKLIVTMNIGDYVPQLYGMTSHFLEKYAKKINAEVKIISERKFPEHGLYWEKFQTYELSREYDFTLFLDADVLIHPDTPDILSFLNKNEILFKGNYTFKYSQDDIYFRRDARYLDIEACIHAASDWTRDLWNPECELTDEDIEKNIFPYQNERNFGYSTKNGYYLDEWQMSRNVAKYGLKAIHARDLFGKFGTTYEQFIYHEFPVRNEDKPELYHRKIIEWKLT
jgi:hypothetical protein